jgi:serine phosphatase RsbU (regulator of sigma subunit)
MTTPFAAGLQNTLVPPVAYSSGTLEARGNTIPLDGVGGDLVDVVVNGSNAVLYAADVSGHGLRAGVLMGMIKSAARFGLLLEQPLPKLLEAINAILPALKEPSMFATLGALAFDGSNFAEYISAGHPPLLHYRRRAGDVIRHSISQFPLGLFPNTVYRSRRIRYDPGDVFALITDGMVETGEDPDPDLALDRLSRTLCDHPDAPLQEILDAAFAQAALDGAPRDDRSLLLVRMAASPAASCQPPLPLEDQEARWRHFLDELEDELAHESAANASIAD